MKAVNEVKPINVLTRFIATWVNERAGTDATGLPFDSFEALTDRPIEQKDVERWLLNCNYIYYLVGNALYERDALPADDAGLRDALALLDEHLKSIRDSNPLNLRSKQPSAIANELGKDWPPFGAKSRNTDARTARGLMALLESCKASMPELAATIKEVVISLQDERSWYRGLETRHAGSPIAERCRELLPLWCAREINPLYSLLLWQDEQAVAELARQLAQAFAANGYPSFDGGSRHDAYLGVVSMSQRLYLDGLARPGCPDDMRAIPLTHLARTLERSGFSLGQPCDAPQVPAWLAGKALLIWNVAVCSVLGPQEAIRPLELNRTSTTLEPAHEAPASAPAGGEVLLRRRLLSGDRELVDIIDLDATHPDKTVAMDGSDRPEYRLWHVLGSSLDERARVPEPLEDIEPCLQGLFLPTARLDARGTQIEGMGDSRFHAMLYLMRAHGTWRVFLRDLGSKNGTFVTRSTPEGAEYYLLAARNPLDPASWSRQMGVPSERVHSVDSLGLERGDLIQLCGSRFELL